MRPMTKSALLILTGILVGCAAATVATPTGPRSPKLASAAGAVQQYCVGSKNFNSVEAVDRIVRKAGEDGWSLVGVYRATPMGMSHEDYICFKRG